MTDKLTFKNNFPGLTVLQLHCDDFAQIQQSLRDKIKQAPMMFIGMQVVLDISAFDKSETVGFDFSQMKNLLQGEGLTLVAVMTDKQKYREEAVAQGVGAFSVVALTKARGSSRATKDKGANVSSKTASKVASQSVNKNETVVRNAQRAIAEKKSLDEPRKNNAALSATKTAEQNEIINHPVRSGQRVYVKGDLTVVGSVSPGAEVIADGSIHIYGALRGRAIAGAKGNVKAKIFCQKLDAELISIAGNYKPNDEIHEEFRHKGMQISLVGEKIQFLPL